MAERGTLRDAELEYQSCYIYNPPEDLIQQESPSKRRRIEREKSPSPRKEKTTRTKQKVDPREKEEEEQKHLLLFPPLLNGSESEDSRALRYDALVELWGDQEKRIQKVLDDVDSEIVLNVAKYVEDTAATTTRYGRLSVGLITLGSNLSSMGRCVSQLEEEIADSGIGKLIVLNSGDGPNLKTALKHIIRAAVTEDKDGNEITLKEYLAHSSDGAKFVPYDLDILCKYVKERQLKSLVIALPDSEAFDHATLSELLSFLSSWTDRLPLVLIFGIATSIELFEGRLPRSVVNRLQGTRFDMQGSENLIDRIYTQIQLRPKNQDQYIIWLGPRLSDMLLENSREHFQSPEAFARSVKYAYMTHFFANPLSILICDREDKSLQPGMCEAIRNTSSFRRHVDRLLHARDTDKVSRLLGDDAFLEEEVNAAVDANEDRLHGLTRAAELFFQIFDLLGSVSSSRKAESIKANLPDFLVQALAGELYSNVVDNILSAVKKMPSTEVERLFKLPTLRSLLPDYKTLKSAFTALRRKYKGVEPLRSEYDNHRLVHSTTLVGQRLQLTRDKANLSEQDMEYTKFIDQLSSSLQSFADAHLFNPREELFLYEVFVHDTRVPIRDAFSPRPRATIERALTKPFDYVIPADVGEENDQGEQIGSVPSNQPATAILYQLYLESGSVINIYDLWSAFYDVVSNSGLVSTSESKEDNAASTGDKNQAVALFYQSLSELKMLGMVKNSKRKADHLAKVTWVGL